MEDISMYNVIECPECGKKLIGVEEHYGVIKCPDKNCCGVFTCYMPSTARWVNLINGVAYAETGGFITFSDSTYNPAKFGT